jgi:hypothetical protein
MPLRLFLDSLAASTALASRMLLVAVCDRLGGSTPD